MTLRALSLSLCLATCLGASPALASTQADSTGLDWSKVPEYRIVPGDKLGVNFGLSPGVSNDLVREARVRSDGRISVYPIGEIIAAGRTLREVQAAIVGMMAAEVREPRVVVSLTEAAGNQVHVIGRVEHPGSYPVGPFTTVVQALTLAGGFSEDAARNSVIVFHRDGARTVSIARLKIDRSLKQGNLAEDVVLSRFDIVYVPRSTIGNVNVFAKQFFSEQGNALNAVFIGWELFNLDRLSVVR